MRFSLRKVLFVFFVLGVIGALGYQVWPKPVAVEAAYVVEGPLEVTLEADGQSRIRERYTITSPVAGVLARVTLHAGDAVSPGQTVARIQPVLLDPTALEQAKYNYEIAAGRVVQAESAIKSAETLLKVAQDEHVRVEGLHKTSERLATKQQVERAWAEVEVKQNGLNEAKEALATSKIQHDQARAAIPRRQWTADLDQASDEQQTAAGEGAGRSAEDYDTLLVAPLEAPGRVLQVMLQGPATIGVATPIMEVGDLSTMEVAIDLLTGDAEKVDVGATVHLKGWGDKPLDGVIDRKDPKAFTSVSPLGVQEQRVNVYVKLTHPPADLGDGFAVEATIFVSQQKEVTQVPIAALFRPAEDYAVYVIENGRATKRTVKLGERNDQVAHVVSGLAPGDLVILHAGDNVKPDAWVKPTNISETASAKGAAESAPSVSRLSK